MRPLRLTLLLSCFVALPIFLTCLSLFTIQDDPADTFRSGDTSHPSRLRSLFTFHTPSSLFPPSAIISLTYDNSTFFLARPAAFGPSLPSKGLSGQLWVGRGFGDEILNRDGDLQISGGELGCSDVPGWSEDDKKHGDQPGTHEKPRAKSTGQNWKDGAEIDTPDDRPVTGDDARDTKKDIDREDSSRSEEDGTDDHLHHPLPDSNPARAVKPGEPADSDPMVNKNTRPTHADIESLQESAAIAGKVVLLSRGGCGFLEKVKWAQRRGGIALIVGDNERGAQLTIMYAKGDTSNVTIPAIFTSYTSAHLLSSLVPPESETDPKQLQIDDVRGDPKKAKAGVKDAGPTFTSLKTSTTSTSVLRPTIVPADSRQSTLNKGWGKNVMARLGLGDDSSHHWRSVEDSRRPPSSGNIDWVLVEDWDEEDTKRKPAEGKPEIEIRSTSAKTTSSRPTSSSSHRPGGDDFVIGVQDWRDTDLVAPKPTASTKKDKKNKAKGDDTYEQPSSSTQESKAAPTGAFNGGSITPGSGEYDSQKPEESKSGSPRNGDSQDNKHQAHPGHGSHESWFKFWRWGHRQHSEKDTPQQPRKDTSTDAKASNLKGSDAKINNEQNEHEGLWVTLTPTSVSASPFFDTLLVLVVSPLVTLTAVYALLLLRSRIRRRRWRAPKSVVERLPVRTYHTLSTSSSTTSSQIPTPNQSSPTSPLLRSIPQDIHSRPRPRSQTTSGIPTSTNAGSSQPPQLTMPVEKPVNKPNPGKRKRYTGRQVECVVCLEEYVDGESRVMSLPCGHEFHAECITPWLVTRRRTCPICKGDVVRSLARSGRENQQELDDDREESEETADDVQERVLEVVNSSPSAAIPIPTREEEEEEEQVDDGDVERGESARGREQEREGQAAPRSNWRNIVSSSLSRLSGDTVWRSNTPDRSR